jgi:hypothetical protein
MADEQTPVAPEAEAAAEAVPDAAAAQPEAAALKRPFGEKTSLAWFSLGFVLLAAAGVLSYAAGSPKPWLLATGLLGWGLLDLAGQAKHLKAWQGAQAASNLLGLSRPAFLMGLGAVLVLQAFGAGKAIGGGTLIIIGVTYLLGYLGGSYALQFMTKAGDSFSHALLLSSFGLGFLALFFFAIQFSLAWACLLGGLSLLMAGWAIYRGVLDSAPSLTPSVAAVTMLLALPLCLFLVREVFQKDVQPVHQGTIFEPRFRALLGGLSREARDLAWAPGHTQPGQPGDIPFSDKLAFIDAQGGRDRVTVYASHEEGGAVTERPLSPGHGRPWWAPGASEVVVTDMGKKKRSLIALELGSEVFEAGHERLFHFKDVTISAMGVMSQDAHSQVFSPDGKMLYFAAPEAPPQEGATRLWSARLAGHLAQPIPGKAYRAYPAASPDSSKLLYVGYKPNVKYIEIGEGEGGKNPRLFNPKIETDLFPAWSAAQTHVLYKDKADVLQLMSANNKADAAPFSGARLNSRVWKSEAGKVFTLDRRETGSLWRLYTMNPKGGGDSLIFETSGEIMPPMWSADSQRIAFVEKDGRRYSVITVGRDGSWPRRVFVSVDKISQLCWSPDAARLAWVVARAEGEEVWIAEKGSLNPERAYEGGEAIASLSWSPGGEHLAFEEKWAFGALGLRLVKPDLYSVLVVDVKDFHARSLTAGGKLARQPAFSPQGVMLAFITEGSSFAHFPGNWSPLSAPKRPATLAVAQLY